MKKALVSVKAYASSFGMVFYNVEDQAKSIYIQSWKISLVILASLMIDMTFHNTAGLSKTS